MLEDILCLNDKASVGLQVCQVTDVHLRGFLVDFMSCLLSLSFLSKVVFESHLWKKTFRCGIHTCTSFYLWKSTFTNRMNSITESFLSRMVSCDWPVRNTWRYWLEFHGCCWWCM